MNVLIVFGMAASCVFLLWIVQSITLMAVGEPLAWPLRFKTRKPLVKMTSRVMIHATWLILIFGTPLALGSSPLKWVRQEFPTPIPFGDITLAISVMLFPIWILYGLWIAAGWVVVKPLYDSATRHRKLIRRFILPWPLATLEEAVFRGVLLEQILRLFPQSDAYTALAIILSSAVFSAAHFVKTSEPGRVWQPAYGLFIVGCLFGLAYVVGGRSLWLPIAVHGSAVFGIEVLRLYIVFRRPAWLLGYAEFPQSGLCGSLLVLFTAVALVVLI